MKKWVLVISLVCIGFIFAIKGYKVTSNQVSKKEQKIEIGLSVDSFILERWQRERDSFVARAKELGAEVNVQNASGSVEEQITQIEYLINKKVDVITIIPVEADALTEVVKKAKKEGIKIIAYDRLIKNANVDLYISFDNEKVGELMAEDIIKNTASDAEVLMINGPLTDNNVLELTKGFDKKIEKAPLNVINRSYVEQWIPEKAFEITSEHLGDIEAGDAIMCGNDSFAGEVIQVLAENRLAGQVCVVGQDADIEACQRIVEGTQSMTVYKPVDQLAKKAATYAVCLAKGELLEVEESIFDGMSEVPYEKLQPIAVTKDNIDEIIIEEGFHSREDVYLNVLE